MGRKLPLDNISLIHPLLYFSFLAAGFAATIAIITAICSVGFRKKSEPDPPQIDPLNVSKDLNSSSPPSNTLGTGESISSEHENEKTEQKDKAETENNEAVIKELPLPPSMLLPKESISCNNMKRVTSERRSSFSVNLKLPRSLSLAKNWEQLKEEKIKGKVKTEDSVWMKTIILGEKCVPDDDEDPVIFEGKGKRVSAYHPKSYSSMSMSVSRQNSSIDSDAVCASQRQEDKINNS